MRTAQLLRKSVSGFVLGIIAATFVIAWVKRMLSRNTRERVQERYRSKQALVRYIQLRHQCSEEAAYQRLAAFVKKHAPDDEQASVEYMAAYDKQRLLDLAQRILMHNPDEIDNI